MPIDRPRRVTVMLSEHEFASLLLLAKTNSQSRSEFVRATLRKEARELTNPSGTGRVVPYNV